MMQSMGAILILFLSTLSLRRATIHYDNYNLHCVISIHALLAESDKSTRQIKQTCRVFLSTLSLRRATRAESGQQHSPDNFYPRSPCGERHRAVTNKQPIFFISIHALLAESDSTTIITICTVLKFLSTLSLRRATHQEWSGSQQPPDFYPRSPCGERLSGLRHKCAIFYFYPRSPCGERQYLVRGQRPNWEISIHALLAESDHGLYSLVAITSSFLSTLSLRRATLHLMFWPFPLS